MENQITQDAEYLLCMLYEAYRNRRKNGELTETSKSFGGSECIQEKFIPEWPTNDIDDAARELKRKGMVDALFADDTLCECDLADDGIYYMEQRFGDKFDKLTQRLIALRTLIFG